MPSMIRKGRPLWNGPLQDPSLSTEDKVKRVLSLASAKICGGRPARDLDQTDYLPVSMACLGLRVVLEMNSYGVLAEALPARNMRYITNISDLRDSIQSCYPSDPTLSLAASSLMSSVEHLSPVAILRNLLDSLQHRLVHAGNIGELVVQFICTLARDAAVDSQKNVTVTAYPTFTVNEFLAHLRKGSIMKLMEVSQGREAGLQRLLKGTMSFTHFSQKRYTPSREDILKSFLRAEAIACMDGQCGIDLIIPVLLDDSPGANEIGLSTCQPLRGVRSDNRIMIEARSSNLRVTASGAQVMQVNLLNDDPAITSKLLDEVMDRMSANIPTDGVEISTERISFILIQVKNRITESSAADPWMDPTQYGIIVGDEKCPPYLAIRHELRATVTSPDMNIIANRFGLVLDLGDESNTPCFAYKPRAVPDDEKVSSLLNKLIKIHVEPLGVCESVNERLSLAFGALVDTIRLSSGSVESIKAKFAMKQPASNRIWELESLGRPSSTSDRT